MSEQGTTGVVYQRPSYTFGPRGYTISLKGRGNCADAEAEMAALIADGWQGTCTQAGDSPKSDISATLSTLDPAAPDANEDLQTSWELDVQWEAIQPVSSRKYWQYLKTFGGGSWAEQVAAHNNIMSVVNSNPFDQDAFDVFPIDSQGWIIQIREGIHVKEPSAVLIRVNSYPPKTTRTVDWVDVNKVWTTAQIRALAHPPRVIIGTLETGYWLKTSAAARYSPDGRFDISTHWVWGSYPTNQYTYKT